MDTIEIRGLRVFGHHGVLPHEAALGQSFVIDVDVHADLSMAGTSDALADTVDYGTLSARLADAVASTRFDLIERLAGHLLDIVMADPRVQRAEVRIGKPHAPVPVVLDMVAVVMRRSR